MTPPILSPASLDRLVAHVEGFLVPSPQGTRDVRSVVTATIGELSRTGVDFGPYLEATSEWGNTVPRASEDDRCVGYQISPNGCGVSAKD